MTVEEIFKKLSAHMIKGFMFHEQMTDYFGFLNLHGYESCHHYHATKEYMAMRELHRFYLDHYGRLIEEDQISNPAVIPSSWYRYTKDQVDPKTKRQGVKDAIERWVAWETEALDLATNMSRELNTINENVAAKFVLDMACDTAKELQWAKKKHIDFVAVDYDIGFIIGQQDHYHDWYKKAMKKLTK